MRPRQASWVGVGGATGADCMDRVPGQVLMEIREVMTESVVTATPDAPVRHVA